MRKEIRRTKINKAIIRTLAVSGAVAVALIAPNVLGALAKMGFINTAQRKQSVQRSLMKLKQRGYLIVENSSIRLTGKGEQLAALLESGRVTSARSRVWDGKWRLLIFDIPERRKRVRNRIRETLRGLGFQRLQDSVWVFPHDCEDLITILKADLQIGRDVLYIIADRIEHDASLRKVFKLPRGYE